MCKLKYLLGHWGRKGVGRMDLTLVVQEDYRGGDTLGFKG